MIIYQNRLRRSFEDYSDNLDLLYFNESLQRKKTAFFCHSHKDKDLVLGLRTIFHQEGIELYIDWTDQTMPDTPNKETAIKLQKRIEKADIFFYLVTENSMKSTWCPWEIGYADAIHQDIYVIPTTTDGNSVFGNEYLKLYKTIQTYGVSDYQISFPDERHSIILNDSNLQESRNG